MKKKKSYPYHLLQATFPFSIQTDRYRTSLPYQHHLQVFQNELSLAYVCYHYLLDSDTAELPHDKAGSWADKIHGLLEKWTHTFIISHLCSHFILMLMICIEYYLHPYFLVLSRRNSLGYVGNTLHWCLCVV